ncbi:hemerythrin domain-containing protein [Streptomyces sp. NPDC127106]|uniref:hemerythrin domain-containing protein n=1 Tax=Streptomyces sp. NPDC127106 TaxID=3345360 RepID=UPI00362F5F03
MSDAIDLTVMYAMHGAVRRELAQLDRVTTAADRDPVRVRATAAGWTLFEQALSAHHAAEDDALWPPLRRNLAGRPKGPGAAGGVGSRARRHRAGGPGHRRLLTEPGVAAYTARWIPAHTALDRWSPITTA